MSDWIDQIFSKSDKYDTKPVVPLMIVNAIAKVKKEHNLLILRDFIILTTMWLHDHPMTICVTDSADRHLIRLDFEEKPYSINELAELYLSHYSTLNIIDFWYDMFQNRIMYHVKVDTSKY